MSNILSPTNSIIELTARMQEKKRFAFVNISRTAMYAVNGNTEKKPPKFILKSLEKCMSIEDPLFLKAIPSEFAEDIKNGLFDKFGLKNNYYYCDAGMFDHYFNNKKEVIDIFINHYIKDSNNIVVSFHDKKTIQKIFGSNQHIISVPYNSYYDKMDSIYDQIAEFDGKVDSCIMDCPLLATAIAPKIWENLNMSIIDFGKIVTSTRMSEPNSRSRFNDSSDKNNNRRFANSKSYEKR
jgi:hypothetical protein